MRHYSLFVTDVCQYGRPRTCLSTRRFRELTLEHCLRSAMFYNPQEVIDAYLCDMSLMDIVRWAETNHGYDFDDNGRYYTSMYNILSEVYGLPDEYLLVLRSSALSVIVYSK